MSYAADRLAGNRRAQEHADRSHRQAQQGDQYRARPPENQGAACRPGRHRVCQYASRVWRAYRGRNREVGQGDPGGQHQAGLIGNKQLAKAALTPSVIKGYLDMEQRWLALARSYEFVETLLELPTEPSRRK